MKRIEIAVCFNCDFVMTTGVMMYSACVNNPENDVTFHCLIDNSVTRRDKGKLMETVSAFSGKQVLFYDVDVNKFKHLKKTGLHLQRITLAAFYRLSLAEILPLELHKVLYVDGDVIIRHSLQSLWNTVLDGCPLAAVQDFIQLKIKYMNASIILISRAISIVASC